MTIFLKAVYFLNMCALLIGMGMITLKQEKGAFHADSITVTFGEQVWEDAIVKSSSGQIGTRTLLFSYFNGVYHRGNRTHDGRPVYVEQNKVEGDPYNNTIGAEIKYCETEKAWVFAHKNIRKSEDFDESECPWLLRSPESSDYNLLDVTGDWSIWTGSIQQGGHFSAVDNECNGEVDCNYHGICDNGKCVCFDDGHFGTRCEHNYPKTSTGACEAITGGAGGTWTQVKWDDYDLRIYQRPVYRYDGGANETVLREGGVVPEEDLVLLMFTGSRWLGTNYKRAKIESPSTEYWRAYSHDFHAFWEEIYNNKTIFASDPSTQSSIIGVDFYMVGAQGEEYGPYGELFPMSTPKGSGFYRCVENVFANFNHSIV